MLAKFSVKKPMTVFVSVVITIVLGVVSFMRMTPDLLPNMDFPYAIIMTTYVGQTPETVESTVTKPLEQSMATIDGVKEITSNSADNYSMMMIEFEDGTDMNTATVDMRSALDTISDAWPDGVGSPYLIKINPNMLPVEMAAIDYSDKDQAEISDFVSEELLNRLEGIDGVASVSTKGILEQTENVVISQEKLDKLNKRINKALDLQFADAENKLKDAKKELNDNIDAAKEGAGTINASIEDINSQQDELANQLADAQKKADSGKTEIISAKMELLVQKSALTETKELLETAYKTLLSLKDTYSQLSEQSNALNDKLNAIIPINESYTKIKAEMEKLSPDSDEYNAFIKQIEEINDKLKPYGLSVDTLEEALKATQEAKKVVDEGLAEIEETLKSMNISSGTLDESLNSMSEKIAQINAGIEQIDNAIDGLDEQSISVSEALSTISKQQSSADFKLSSALSTLTSKQTEVNGALTQLESAQKEVQTQIDTLSDTKNQAKDSANMNNTVTIDTVSGILTAQNFSMPAGYVSDKENNKYMIRVGDEINSEKEMKSLVLFDTGIDGIGVVKLEDVADVFVADNSNEIYAKINNQNGVVLSFSKQSDAATSTVCENINSTFEQLEAEYDGLHFTNLYSQGDYIGIVINSVLQNLLIGAALAIIILFLFLRDIRPTVIVACSIPISVIFAIVLMYFSGVTMNMISLSGLAIGVGMLVDNSVVVIENIYRLRGLGYSAIRAAVSGAGQVAGAITSSTLTTMCVFLPIVFVEGITRQLFSDIALVIGYSLLASLIVALTLIPAMSQRMLRKTKEQKDKKNSKILNAYEKSLRFALRHKVVTLLVVVAILFASVAGALAKGFSFMPSMSSTEISVTAQLEDNATFEETVETAEKINNIMREYKEFDTVGVLVGSTSSLLAISGSSNSTSNDAGYVSAYGVLNESYAKQSESISAKLEKSFEGIDGEVTVSGGSASSMTSMLGNNTVDIVLYGDDLDTLKNTANDIAKTLEDVDGVSKADSGVGATSPELRVSVDKQKAIKKGLTVAQVYQQVAAAISDKTTSTILTNDDGESMDVVVVKDNKKKVSSDDIGDIKLTYTNKDGEQKSVALSEIATISKSEAMDVINRQNQKRYLTISAFVADGSTVTVVSNNIKSALDKYDLPKGCSIEYSGSDATTMEAVEQLMMMILLGVILIYLIMVAQFQSLKSPFIIMFTIPLAFTGGFLGLIIAGFDVSVVSLIGFVMLCGIIVNNGIVLVDYINNLRANEGKERVEAIVEAGRTRMRPILITALTTILGLSVMALGIGTGAEMMQPIAIVCIGGLIYATFMTLFIIPVIYDIFSKKELRKVDEKDLELIDESTSVM
ncbi:MAG: efflux RND transporter permease subunit [Ruminococcus sp.]|nr:efflux RND transporter permease subunit [Ruminococcus sp.]